MLPGFETPDTLVIDLRECFSSMVEKGRIIFKVPEGVGEVVRGVD